MGKSMLAVIAAIAMATGQATAQQEGQKEVEVRAGDTRIQVDPAERQDSEARGAARAERRQAQGGQQTGAGLALRATDFEGLEIRNMQGEDLGEVEDVVIDLQNGRVRYIAMSTGGVLGVGGKMFAIPWNAFRYRMEDDEQFLVLNATAEKFENAPGFDENNWPNFADRQWRMTNDRFYGEQGFVEQERVRGREGELIEERREVQRRRQQRDAAESDN